MIEELTPQEKWERDNGDLTKILDYPLDSTSQVIELGGYIGEWTQKIVERYNPKLLIIEPVPVFYKKLLKKFFGNTNVTVDLSAFSTTNIELKLYVSESATSETISVSDTTIDAKAYDIEHFVQKYNLGRIDLIQVNIECEEYPLLLQWVKTDFLKNVKYIQIQFHTFCEDYEERYNIISQGLKDLGFEIRYRYDFVWESWENKNL